MNLNLGQSLSQKQSLTLDQRISMRLEHVQQVNEDWDKIEGELGLDLRSILSGLMERIAEKAPEDLQSTLSRLSKDEEFIASIMGVGGRLATPERDKALTEAMLRYLHARVNGEFHFDGEAGVPEKLSLGRLRDAFIDQAKAEAELKIAQGHIDQSEIDRKAGLTKSAAITIVSNEGFFKDFKEQQTALRVAYGLKTLVDNLSNIAKLFVAGKDPAVGKSLVTELFKDYDSYKKFKFMASDRLCRRFSSRALQFGENAKSEELRIPLMNTVGEYSLIAMGVISPEIFQLRDYEITKEEMDGVRAVFAEQGLDLDTVMKHWALKGEGTLFWNRWGVVGRKPDANADNAVREYITKVIREDMAKLFSPEELEAFLNEIKAIIAKSPKGGEGRADARMEIESELVSFLSDEDFQVALLERITARWNNEAKKICFSA